ncbi:hypothetical protein B9Z55_016758 [Caenorhabditis nigoni]|uniref:Peptidase A1 domain-containing protein n=1 Tax=Caenorhabditis nigoni TaxID=1611254 RepID=A0A2G5T6W9_9PELO|nr:hypothetical protein B9Z55_016758 [Caenorhabditis nigoni]
MITILLLLVASSTAAVLEHQLVWKESRMVQMIRNGEYPAYLEYRDRLVAARTSNLATVVQSATDYVYYEYMGNVTVGTPDQNFIVVLDTGSANLLIPGTNCTTYCENKRLFNEKESITYVATNKPWQIKYASGDAYGTLGIDTVKSPKEGVFGLAFTALAVDNITPPLINAINQGLLDQPIFTTWFGQRGALGTSASGAFTYGGLDRTHCGPVIGYAPLTNARHFQFQATGFSLGSYQSTTTYEVITDTATSFLCGPQAAIDSLAKAAGATWDQTNQVYNIPCGTDAGPIKMKIGAFNYVIRANNYILQIDTNSCLFAAIPQSYAGFGPAWILGGPFMRQYCNVHDIGQKRVGFCLSLQ